MNGRPVHIESDDPADVQSRLAGLGLQPCLLAAAVGYAAAESFHCTLHDPPTAPGMRAYFGAVRYLRDELVPLGWTPSNERNYCTTVHPLGTMAIATCSGNEATGRPHETPATRSVKGPVTHAAVSSNQIALFDTEEFSVVPVGDTADGLVTWILLYHIDERAGEVRHELALPTRITDGHVDGWRERIILTPLSIESVLSKRPPALVEEEIDVNVERRAN